VGIGTVDRGEPPCAASGSVVIGVLEFLESELCAPKDPASKEAFFRVREAVLWGIANGNVFQVLDQIDHWAAEHRKVVDSYIKGE
jgi:hypothetical protein